MGEYFQNFCDLMLIKSHPSEYEQSLFKKTQKYCRYISWIPGLKMVAVCNSLSMYATKGTRQLSSSGSTNLSSSGPTNLSSSGSDPGIQSNKIIPLDSHFHGNDNNGSDIDLFIITSPKRMWLVRVAVTVIFQILGVRRHGKKVKDRFCLSFFITENAMDFSQIAIENDIYLFYWIYYLKPIVNKDFTYEKFIKTNKTLGINEINLHPDNKVYEIKPVYVISSEIEKSINKLLNPLLDFKNWALKKIFLPKTLAHKKRLGDPYGIIVSDDILKFSDNDRRVEIRDEILKS